MESNWEVVKVYFEVIPACLYIALYLENVSSAPGGGRVN